MDELQPLMDQMGIQFRKPELLQLALTHRSYINEHPDFSADNERLEFLGDAVLDFVVGAYLYTTFEGMQEGEMTSLRAALVRAETLADFAIQLTIDQHMRLGQGEQDSGGRRKNPTLCAGFEAVIGAVYLDQGLEALTTLIERLIEPTLDHIRAESLHKDSKSEFQMWAQANHAITPRYEVISASGPDHEKTFTVQVLIGDDAWGEGSGSSKRRAAQAAAGDAILRADAVDSEQLADA